MKIVVFGGAGQLGFEIIQRARDLNFEVVAPVIDELNITEREQVRFLVERARPSVVINAAAYTAVDRAEADRDAAFAVNCDGARNVAEAAHAVNARMIHVSTDYVFDGTKGAPYTESDATHPLNVYGLSKCAGDEAVLATLGNKAMVVRTAWLHGQRGPNFVQTMLKLFAEHEVVRVVNDQIGSPTWAGWLAEVLLDMCRVDAHGVFHAVNSGHTSWHGFAEEVLRQAGPFLAKRATIRIDPQSTVEAARPAKRPALSVLSCERLISALGRKPLSWQEGIRAHLVDLGVCPAGPTGHQAL